MSFECSFATDGVDYELLIEDDGQVCYAYLYDADGKISGHVWLYNRGPNPKSFEDPRGAPPRNPEEFVADERIALPESGEDVSAQWWRTGGVLYARVFIRKALVGILAPGTKPGWSALAKKDGPVAKALTPSSPSNVEEILQEIRDLGTQDGTAS